MKHLKAYFESQNWIKRLMKQPELRIEDLDQAMAAGLFSNIDNDLSPENLCCDGELSATKVRIKKRMLDGAAVQLFKMGYRPTGEMYCLTVPE